MAEWVKRVHANDLKLAEIADWEETELWDKESWKRKATLVKPEEMETDENSEEDERERSNQHIEIIHDASGRVAHSSPLSKGPLDILGSGCRCCQCCKTMTKTRDPSGEVQESVFWKCGRGWVGGRLKDTSVPTPKMIKRRRRWVRINP